MSSIESEGVPHSPAYPKMEHPSTKKVQPAVSSTVPEWIRVFEELSKRVATVNESARRLSQYVIGELPMASEDAAELAGNGLIDGLEVNMRRMLRELAETEEMTDSVSRALGAKL
jgi:hypothetical protein